MVLTTVSTLDELLNMDETPFARSLILPNGKMADITGLARTGPKLLGYDSISIIAPDRANKPQYTQEAEYTPQDMEMLSELIRSNPDMTLDLLLGKLQEQKKKMGLENCPFCDPNVTIKTPQDPDNDLIFHEGRIYHKGLHTESGKPVISVPNIKSFMPGHFVTVFADHKTSLADLSYEDIVNYFVSGQQLAEYFKRKKAKGIVDFMNWGKRAAASVPHPHGQRGMIIEGMESMYRQCDQANLFQLNGDKSLMERMMGIIRTKHNGLYVFENDQILIWTPYAPTWPDQTEVIFKNEGNILDFSDYDLRIAARSMLGVIHCLMNHRGVTAINLVLYQSNFDCEKNGFRMRAVISPRNKNNIGGLEIGQGVYVIPTVPEETAMVLKQHYHGR